MTEALALTIVVLTGLYFIALAVVSLFMPERTSSFLLGFAGSALTHYIELFLRLLIGGALGTLIGRLVVYLRSHHQESVGLDEFLALGLIALTYGLALLSHTYGFLAVFAAGLALQRVKERPTAIASQIILEAGLQSKEANTALATDSGHASAYMMQEVRGFNEQLERTAELAVVLVMGAGSIGQVAPALGAGNAP